RLALRPIQIRRERVIDRRLRRGIQMARRRAQQLGERAGNRQRERILPDLLHETGARAATRREDARAAGAAERAAEPEESLERIEERRTAGAGARAGAFARRARAGADAGAFALRPPMRVVVRQ